MKLETIFCFCVGQLLITIAAVQVLKDKPDFPDNVEYFHLKFRNGTEITALTREFQAVYHQLLKEIERLPRYKEILNRGNKKMNDELKQMEKKGASRMEMSAVAGNMLADVYEELFAEAGLKLKIYNREPIFLV